MMVTAVVIDHGGHTCKAGFAGELTPRTLLSLSPAKGKAAPIQRGVVTNWEAVESAWEQVYSRELYVAPQDHPLVLTESILNTSQQAERKCEIAFEKLGCQAVFLCAPSVLSMYASGLMTGVAVDCGDSVTTVLPMFEGIVQAEGLSKSNLSGSDVTDHLRRLLQRRRKAGTLPDFSDRIVGNIKESISRVPAEATGAGLGSGGWNNNSKTFSDDVYVPYRLPDGQVIEIGEERFRCGEILFEPYNCGHSGEGVQCQIFDSILQCPSTVRSALCKNILLSGGSTQLESFPKRLKAELEQLAPAKEFRIHGSENPQFSAWLGGAMISQLSTFSDMCMLRQEYAEKGMLAVESKFFSYLSIN